MRRFVSMLALAAVVGLAGGALADDEKKGKAPAGKLFEKMDADGDGKVSKDEFKKFFEERAKDKGRGDKAGELMLRLFARADANSDGHLSRDEFAKFADTFGDREKLKEKLKKLKKEG